MRRHLSADCWQAILSWLDARSVRQMYAVNQYHHHQVLNFQLTSAAFVLCDELKDETNHVAGTKRVPQYMRQVIGSGQQWCQQWAAHGSFWKRDALRAWNLERPISSLEQHMIADIQTRFNRVTELRLLDRRTGWTCWDSEMPVHAAVVEHLFVHCKELQHIHIEHFCLSSTCSLQASPTDAAAAAQWALPCLKSVVLLDSQLDQQLMQHLGRYARNLTMVHVQSISPHVTEEDFREWFAALPRLSDIRIGYTFKQGHYSRRQLDCPCCSNDSSSKSSDATSCASLSTRPAAVCDHTLTSAAGLVSHHGRTFNVCVRESIDGTVCAALLAACGPNTIHSVHLTSVTFSNNDMHHADEVAVRDRIFQHSLGTNGGESLRRLWLGATVPLSLQQLTTICNRCHGTCVRECVHACGRRPSVLRCVCVRACVRVCVLSLIHI